MRRGALRTRGPLTALVLLAGFGPGCDGNAEGVPASVWQHFILPAMTVFQAKNAYGHGCPWSCPHTVPVNYDTAQFPVAQKHTDSHFGMTYPLRAPNDASTVEAVAEAFAKVFTQIGELQVPV